MTVPSEFALLYYGKGIVMLADSILCVIANLLISYMVFVRDIQELSIATHLKGSSSDVRSSFHMHQGRWVR